MCIMVYKFLIYYVHVHVYTMLLYSSVSPSALVVLFVHIVHPMDMCTCIT